MRPRLILFCVLIFALVIAGVASRFAQGNDETEINTSGILALAAGFCLYLIEAVWSAPQRADLRIQRHLSADRVSPGRPVEVNLVVTNDGPDLPELYLDEILPARLSLIEGRTHLLTSLKSGEEIEWTYTVEGDRGDFYFGDITATASEQTGLFKITQALETGQRLIVQPLPRHMRHIPIRPPQTRGFAGPIPARQSGTGTDFFTVREYQPGDALRHINWKLSARQEQQLITNVFEQQRIADVGIILDARQPAYAQAGMGNLFEHAVRAAADLAENFLNEGNRVGMLVYGSAIDRAFPGYGKVQRQNILRLLARATPGFNYALEKLDNLPTRFFPSRSQIILISPLLPDDEKVLPNLCAKGYHVLLVSPNPINFESRHQGSEWVDQMALRIATAERRLQINRLRRSGIVVADWDVKEALDPVLQALMARTPQTGGRRL